MERLTIEWCGNYAPKELCSKDELGEVNGCDSCEEYCVMADFDCDHCAIQELFNRLAKYEDMHEKIEKKIEETRSKSSYPSSSTRQILEDLEWVLSLLD